MKFYVYAYLDLRKPGKYVYDNFTFDYEPFYVGKGKGDRKVRMNGYNVFFKDKYSEILEETGVKPTSEILLGGLLESKAFEMEIMLINLIGRSILNEGPLTNIAQGGCGVAGQELSEEHKCKLSASLKGRRPWNTGRKLSEEHKSKIARPGKENGFYGKRHSDINKNKHSEFMKIHIEKYGAMRKGAVLSSETKAKISNGRIGKKHTEETKRKMRRSAKNRPLQSTETRKKRSETLMGHSVSEATRKKISEALKRRCCQ